jgi:hypothetical protein
MRHIKHWFIILGIVIPAVCMGYDNRPYLPGYDGKTPTVKTIELGKIMFNDMLWLENNTIYLLNQPQDKNKENKAWSVDVQNGTVKELDANETSEIIAIKNSLRVEEKAVDTSAIVNQIIVSLNSKMADRQNNIRRGDEEYGNGVVYSIDKSVNEIYYYYHTAYEQKKEYELSGWHYVSEYFLPNKDYAIGIHNVSNTESIVDWSRYWAWAHKVTTWYLSPDKKYLMISNNVYTLDDGKKPTIMPFGERKTLILCAPSPDWTKICYCIGSNLKSLFGNKALQKNKLLVTDFDLNGL